ncbi:hypothetical protein VC83_09210 [Pseudogymnoascus destructans]|uniref:Uncharacterized protein n=1 Tax=Pseudogymnoascus destructans TaxID=655981 RepID=A0A176ZZ18_9PEZI|nr:uncharacterized protein VC83_09210 [Pseudogymnoascus destructans]OAF54570.1 hypothetical protein VC83_09210 [Pseudogymnoascus destructans]
MEAASARMATRDRFSQAGDLGPTPLQRFIQQACSPEYFEPNLSLNLEIADLINSKKGNAPREAAVAIVNYINHRNPNVALLALSLLDICVKNCGYPFQLQVGTKEFLNELVRRFPERPPVRATRVQLRILEAIEEWKSTICQTSRYKEDLGFIRDMHRLLSYKGYTFPQVRREDAAVLNPSDNLKSAEEMEEEERSAQSAKLQELIRRSGPEDLQEANRLMKIMAGYDTRSKTDYRAKAAEEVGKIQQKAKLLEERLEAFQPGETMTEGDVYEELAASLQSAHPKIQKMCEEESDDHEAVAKLFEINDSINRTVERYKLMKKGDIEAASKIAKGTLGTTTGVAKNAANELSLIDFDADGEGVGGASSSAPPSKPGGLEDDLLGLSMGESTISDAPFGQSGAIGLGFGANRNIPGPSLISSTTENNSARAPTPAASTASPALTQANYAGFQPPAQQPPSDPFAALTQPLRQSTPQLSSTTPSMFDFGSNTSTPNPNATNPPVSTDDDEWEFESALPKNNGLPSNVITLTDSVINITAEASRKSNSDPAITISLRYSNKTPMPISDLELRVAVPKKLQGISLKWETLTGTTLQPLQKDGISQVVHLNGVALGQGNNVRLRWQLLYKLGGDSRQEQGEIPTLGVA